MNRNLGNAAVSLTRFLREANVEGEVTIDIRVADHEMKHNLLLRFLSDLSPLDRIPKFDIAVQRSDRFELCGLKFRIMTRIGDEQ